MIPTGKPPVKLWAPLNRRLTSRWVVNPTRNRARLPLASLSFDDFPRSAWLEGGSILRHHGLKATYYAVGRFAGQTLDGIDQYLALDLKDIVAEGHEIGSHSFSHLPVHTLSNADIRADEAANQAFFREHLGDYQVTGFAYPYGEASPRTKGVYNDLYVANRGIIAGLNATWFDLAQLKAVGLERRSWRADRIEALIRHAARRKAWLIFYTHDVSDDPSPYGATPDMLDHAITTLKAEAIEILPVKHALARTQFGGA